MLNAARSLASRVKRVLRPSHVTLQRETVAWNYLRGQGLEIGALHHPQPHPPSVKVTYVDRLPVADLLRQYPDLARETLVPVDLVDDGEQLHQVADGSQDFVIANHFLEHCQDPIGALGHFLRVLKPGGIIYLAVPDKRFTFDRDRPVTPLEHLLEDHEHGPDSSRRQHFEEWVRLVEKVTDAAQAEERLRFMLEVDYSIHFHVWTQAEFLIFLAALKEMLPLEIELFFKLHQEMIVVLRKVEMTIGA